MNIQQAQALARKVLAGEAGPEETAALRQYLADHSHVPELADLLLPVEELAAAKDEALPSGMEERVLRPIMDDIPAPVLSPRRPAVLRSLLRMSAAAAVLISVCLLTYQLFFHSSAPQVSAMQFDEVSTEAGHSREITLVDSTRIRLNGGTTLRFPRSFSATREVYLEGEAFFEVRKDLAHPFIIHAPTFTTTVLGTSFNVKSSVEQQLSEVSVATGKVRVQLTGQTVNDSLVYLLAGDKASYHSGNVQGWQKSKTDIAMVGAWRDHHFYYERAPLSIILNDLEKSYGLRFRVKNTGLLSCTYTVTFRNMEPEEILSALSLLGGIRFQIKDSLLEVSGQVCN